MKFFLVSEQCLAHSLWQRTHTLLFLVLLALFACAGCEHSTSIAPADYDLLGTDGSLTIEVGQSASLHVYESMRGYEISGDECAGDANDLTAEDPTIVHVAYLGVARGHVEVNGKPDTRHYEVTGLRYGDTTIRARCSGRDRAQVVHVVPAGG